MSRKLVLPTEGGATKELEISKSVVIVGANGAGKTRLGSWLDLNSPMKLQVHRISAQKSLAMPDSTSTTSLSRAERGLRYGYEDIADHEERSQYKIGNKWGSKPNTGTIHDYPRLLTYLFSEHSQEGVRYMQESHRTAERVTPPKTKLMIVKETWELLLPHRELEIGSQEILSKVKGAAATYKASEMSDGERVIFYLIGQCLAADKDGFIVIDEPELHLHKSIQAALWMTIESLRPDCMFIYITHDVDFAAGLTEAKRIWLQSFDGSSWKWSEINDVEGFPSALLFEVLGSRRPIVFVEGDSGSHDLSLYRAILKDFLVIPVGGCGQVIQSVRALRKNEQLHYHEVYGIIDRDRRGPAEIEALMKDNIFVLSVAEVENLFCVPEVLSLVSKSLMRDSNKDLESVKAIVFESLKHDQEAQVSMRVISELKFRINYFNEKTRGENAIKEEVISHFENSKISKLYQDTNLEITEVLDKNDYEGLLRLYNRKSLSRQIAQVFDLKGSALADFVIRLSFNVNSHELVSALNPYFAGFFAMTKK